MESQGRESPNKGDDLGAFINRLAGEVVDRHMAAPAVMLLESSKPFTFVGSQAIVFFDPILSMLGFIKDYDKYRSILEDREKVERLIRAIEEMEEEKINRKKVNKDEKRGH